MKSSILILKSGRCAWGRCIFCGYGRIKGYDATIENVLDDFKKFFENLKDGVEEVKVFGSGSFFDEKQVPPDARDYFIKKCKEKKLKAVVESRPEFITDDIDFHDCEITVAFGLESSSNETLSKIRKGFKKEDFERAAGIVRKKGGKVRAYVLVNYPSDIPILENVERDLIYALNYSDTIVLINLIPHYNAPLMRSWLSGEWSFLNRSDFFDVCGKAVYNIKKSYLKKAVKKLFNLVKIKIKLARDSGTSEVSPSPLKLIEKFSGVEITTVDGAETYTEKLKNELVFENQENLARIIIELNEIIEGVKYRFEPAACMISGEFINFVNENENEIKKRFKKINLVFHEKLSLIIPDEKNGNDEIIFMSDVPSSVAPVLYYIDPEQIVFRSKSDSLLVNAIVFAMRKLGAEVMEEKLNSITIEYDPETFKFVPKFPNNLKEDLKGVGEDYLVHPHYEVWQDYICRWFVPKRGILLFLPCSFVKPYYESKTHKKITGVLKGAGIRDYIDEVMITSAGVVPREYENLYPFNAYDWDEKYETAEIKERYIEVTAKRIENYIRHHKKHYENLVKGCVYCFLKYDSESYIALKIACDNQRIRCVNLLTENTYNKLKEENVKKILQDIEALNDLGRLKEIIAQFT